MENLTVHNLETEPYTYLKTVLESIRYQKEKSIQNIESLNVLHEEMINLPLDATVDKIKQMNIPSRIPIPHSIDAILTNVPADLSRRYRTRWQQTTKTEIENQLVCGRD